MEEEMTRVAELFLLAGFLLARDNKRGRNLRRSVYDHFTRFRDAPNPSPVPMYLRLFGYGPSFKLFEWRWFLKIEGVDKP